MRNKVFLAILVATMIAGLVCLVLRPSHLPAWAALIVGIFIWAGVAAACALALKALSGANDFWQALAAMHSPRAVLHDTSNQPLRSWSGQFEPDDALIPVFCV